MNNFLKSLFGQTKPSADPENEAAISTAKPPSGAQDITRPLSPHLDSITSISPIRADFPQLQASCYQSVGKQRDHNEDALFIMTSMLAGNERQFPFGIYIVADGMGGHQHGEIASEIASLTMAGHLLDQVYRSQIRTNPEPPETPLREILAEGVIKAHEAILENAPGGGTTLTALLIVDNQMAIAHVGDSRVYAINKDNTLHALTRDHSLVKRLEELGQLTADEAAVHPQKNVLYRALGQGEPFEPEIITALAPEAGHLLVCSDGLWGLVPEITLGSIANTTPTLNEACQKMVAAANDAGGPDNITAILVRLP